MITNYLKTILFISLISLLSFACNNGSSKDGKDGDSTVTADDVKNAPADVSAICLWSSLTLRETPDAKGKYKNTMYLGEKAIYMGQKVTDSTDKKSPKEYVKVKLTDGSQGWVQSTFVAIGAKTYVLRDKTKLYKRPDILSAGKDEFDKMQFVVVTEEQGEWVKIKGKKTADKWFKDGWVKSDRLVDSEVDVTVAILCERALLKDTQEKKIEALKEIVDNTDFSASMFINDVRTILDSLSNPSTSGDNQPVEEYYEGD
jgi:hypothetical protein